MRQIQHSIRVPLSVDKALRQAAHNRQVTTYSLIQQCVRVGFASLSIEQATPHLTSEIAHEVGGISARLAHLERLMERTLYVACAAYVFSRAGASTRADENNLTAEINAAFVRQINLAGEI